MTTIATTTAPTVDDVCRVYDDDHPHELPLDQLKQLIGGKAANLTVMSAELGLPVPPAFFVTTGACRAYLAGGWPERLDDEIRSHLARVEERVGRRFGDPKDPLLVSVRSGAAVSMPGMMDTILNLGLNDATTAGLAASTGDASFAADCRARFAAMYRSVVGSDAPEDPWAQLHLAVEAVFRSWNSPRAKAYRAKEGIPDDLGTAVTVQAMVFGNRSSRSGTGVLFTRNPATGQRALYGDVMFQAQGEDVVAGTHRTMPIDVLDERLPEVGSALRRDADVLERHFADLCDIEFTIEQGTLWLLQVRVGKRSPQAALRIAIDMAEDPDFPLSREEAVRRVAPILADPPTIAARSSDHGPAIARGLPASPGIAAGEITLTPAAAAAAGGAGRPTILVRSETSPDDVHGMAKAAGVLTSSGGLASHAAVVARGWGIPAVVGATEVRVAPGEHEVVIGDRRCVAGDPITIDGSTGEVFAGAVAGSRTVVPEAATLLAWARELGIDVGRSGREGAHTGTPADDGVGRGGEDGSDGHDGGDLGDVRGGARVGVARDRPADVGSEPAPGIGDAIRALAIKGFAGADALAVAIRASVPDAGSILDRLVADGLAESAVGSFRLTTEGRAAADRLIAEDARGWGPERAMAALDAFVALDVRMKEIVTAWQTREVDGATTFNDHADSSYEAAVLARFGALVGDADAWLAPLAGQLPRLGEYRTRLALAAGRAIAGDGRYVASPRVDSYHGVWFELHEDLIRLAGRTRAEEVAAGRA